MAKQQYDNNNSGALFKNDRKTEEKHPDYKGSAEINGVQYWVSSWIKECRQGQNAGKKFMSLSFKPKDTDQPKDAGEGGSFSGSSRAGAADDGDDAPF